MVNSPNTKHSKHIKIKRKKNAMSNDTVSFFSHKYPVYHHPILNVVNSVLSLTHSTRLSYAANVNETSNSMHIVRRTVNETESV